MYNIHNIYIYMTNEFHIIDSDTHLVIILYCRLNNVIFFITIIIELVFQYKTIDYNIL